MNKKELKVLNKLVGAWASFLKLVPLHDDETEEFRKAIHAAQYIVMARPARREINLKKTNK